MTWAVSMPRFWSSSPPLCKVMQMRMGGVDYLGAKGSRSPFSG